MEIEAKNCPLCGSSKITFAQKWKYNRKLFTLSCKICHCGVFNTDFDDLFKSWNHRKRAFQTGGFTFTDEELLEYRSI